LIPAKGKMFAQKGNEFRKIVIFKVEQHSKKMMIFRRTVKEKEFQNCKKNMYRIRHY